jgi:hypothetical protein
LLIKPIFLYLAMMAWAPYSIAEPLIVRHVKGEAGDDPRNRYVLDLLNLVMTKSGVEYQLVPVDIRMPQSRALVALRMGELVDVVWSMTSIEREHVLLPIRYSLDKGMIGIRLLLIREGEQHIFNHVNTLADLQLLRAGQGHDWPDTAILQANGFNVQTSVTYSGLFEMLIGKRFSFLPRSAEEIWAEAEVHKDKGLIVENSLALYYPTSSYFFVKKNNLVLAQHIEKGFEESYRDGSFQRLFMKYFEPIIKELQHRKVIKLANPLLPDKTPLNKKELWFTPEFNTLNNTKKSTENQP